MQHLHLMYGKTLSRASVKH